MDRLEQIENSFAHFCDVKQTIPSWVSLIIQGRSKQENICEGRHFLPTQTYLVVLND